MKPSDMTNEELASFLEDVTWGEQKVDDSFVLEVAARLRRRNPVDDDLLKMARDIDAKNAEIEKLRALTVRSDNSKVIAELQRRLKVADDALEAASDAFRFCIEQCELELGPRMIGKLCDDGKAVERAITAIREKGGNDGH